MYDDQRRNKDMFVAIADKKAGSYSADESSVLYDVVNCCLQNAYKKRLPIHQVYKHAKCMEG